MSNDLMNILGAMTKVGNTRIDPETGREVDLGGSLLSKQSLKSKVDEMAESYDAEISDIYNGVDEVISEEEVEVKEDILPELTAFKDMLNIKENTKPVKKSKEDVTDVKVVTETSEDLMNLYVNKIDEKLY